MRNRDLVVASLSELIGTESLSRMIERRVEEHLSPSDKPIGRRINDMILAVQSEGSVLPSSITLAGKTLYQTEGLCRKLDANFDPMQSTLQFVMRNGNHLMPLLLSSKTMRDSLSNNSNPIVSFAMQHAARLIPQSVTNAMVTWTIQSRLKSK